MNVILCYIMLWFENNLTLPIFIPVARLVVDQDYKTEEGDEGEERWGKDTSCQVAAINITAALYTALH